MSIINPHTGEPMSSPTTPSVYLFDPQSDITTEELAYVVREAFSAMGMAITDVALEEVPDDIKRHFVGVDPQGEG